MFFYVRVMCMDAIAHGGQKRMFHPLWLGLQVAVNCPTRVLGTKLGSRVRVACVLNF